MSNSPVNRSITAHKFRNEINKAIKNDIWRKNYFETLVEQKAVELGLELKCSKCGSWGWYPMKQLGYNITCELCLKPFNFPITHPGDSNQSNWAYRVIGPFALPKYADGGYASALAIRFFADVIGGKVGGAEATWSSGQNITLASGKESEADFILWYQRKHMMNNDYPTQILFGEAKSFGKDAFKEIDITRMRLLAEEFPGSILVFATMKEANELSKEEIKRIKKLAEWGREYDKERRQTRAPVIVLTGTELFSAYTLDISWENKGGKHKELAESARLRIEKLNVLADLTQQLYLGMEPYYIWRDKKWKKKRNRIQKSK